MYWRKLLDFSDLSLGFLVARENKKKILLIVCSMYDKMSQKEDKVRVNARVPKYLYDWVCSVYDNTSQAINEGLELLKESETKGCHTGTDNVCHIDIQEHTHQDEKRANEQQARIEELNSQIKAFYDQLYKNDEHIKTLEERLRRPLIIT